MSFNRSPRATVFPDARTAAAVVAARLAGEIESNPTLVLGLATGRTPVALYAELVRLSSVRALEWSSVTTFNLDEFVGLPAGHPGSYRSFMNRHLFDHVNLSPDRINFLDGMADPAAECRRYEAAIAAAGGIDLQILGIGTNGHIGFNEPGPKLESRTHRIALESETRRNNADLFGGEVDQVPAEALSMGMATILQAGALILLAHGGNKASCVERALRGPLTTGLPASFLQLHHDVDVILDAAAAAALDRART